MGDELACGHTCGLHPSFIRPASGSFGSLTFQSKAQAKNPEETDLIIWLDEIKICEASFAQNK